jgi:hypothetical protein
LKLVVPRREQEAFGPSLLHLLLGYFPKDREREKEREREREREICFVLFWRPWDLNSGPHAC